jgi:hypothetical protein
MDEKMTKGEILGLIREEREALEKTLRELNEAQMIEPGVESDWSVKDILAHITDWELRMVRWIEESQRGEVPQRPEPGMTWDDLDQLNDRIFRLNKDRPLRDVVADFHASFQKALEAVDSPTEADLLDPERFEWRDGDPMWQMVAANTWWHYKEHNETISNWSKGR